MICIKYDMFKYFSGLNGISQVVEIGTYINILHINTVGKRIVAYCIMKNIGGTKHWEFVGQITKVFFTILQNF